MRKSLFASLAIASTLCLNSYSSQTNNVDPHLLSENSKSPSLELRLRGFSEAEVEKLINTSKSLAKYDFGYPLFIKKDEGLTNLVGLYLGVSNSQHVINIKPFDQYASTIARELNKSVNAPLLVVNSALEDTIIHESSHALFSRLSPAQRRDLEITFYNFDSELPLSLSGEITGHPSFYSYAHRFYKHDIDKIGTKESQTLTAEQFSEFCVYIFLNQKDNDEDKVFVQKKKAVERALKTLER